MNFLQIFDTSCPPEDVGGMTMYPASCPDESLSTGSAVLLAIVLVMIAAELVSWFFATRHRGRVSDRAWKVADVDRDAWLVWNIWHLVPFSNVYYLVVLRPKLDRAERQLAKYGG